MTGEAHWITLAVVLGGGFALLFVGYLAAQVPVPVRRVRQRI